MNVDQAVAIAVPHSDIKLDNLALYAEEFVAAVSRTEGNILEFGTRQGGSAYLWLMLLREMGQQRLVVTVDPYGSKPYGDSAYTPYGDAQYVAAKTLLAPFANHAHFTITSQQFLGNLADLRMWVGGAERPLYPLAFAFLDAEHSFESESDEADSVMRWMAEGGTILIDNAAQHGYAFREAGFSIRSVGQEGLVVWR